MTPGLSLRVLSGILVAYGAAYPQYLIDSVAGGGPPYTPAYATQTFIGNPEQMAVDSDGNLYFSSSLNCVFKIDAQGIMTRIAGNGRPEFTGDGGPATNAGLRDPMGVAVDRSGNVYIADSSNQRVRRVSPDGIITTIAGNGSPGIWGDDGPATSATLAWPGSVAVDPSGNLFIASSSLVRKVSTDGTITTFAGSSYVGSTDGRPQEGVPANSVVLGGPLHIASDQFGNIYISDTSQSRIRKVAPSGIITTIVGDGQCASSGNGGPATSAQVCNPTAVAVDGAGSIYITEREHVRKIASSGEITSIFDRTLDLSGPTSLAVDSGGRVYLCWWHHQNIGFLSAGKIVPVAGSAGLIVGDGGPAMSAQLAGPIGLAVDAADNLYILDSAALRLRKVTTDGTISTVCGDGVMDPFYTTDGLPASRARFYRPTSVAIASDGSIYITDGNLVRKISPDGIIRRFAGSSNPGSGGDGGPAISAQLFNPRRMAFDQAGNLYVMDAGNSRVRKISLAGIITTVAGNGWRDYSGDGGLATEASLLSPNTLAIDASGSLYIGESRNVIRKVTLDGRIWTVAGVPWEMGFGDNPALYRCALGDIGENIPATGALLCSPNEMAFDAAGNLLLADVRSNRIRKISPDGVISTIAGQGGGGYTGDRGPALQAQLQAPSSIVVGRFGRVYVSSYDAKVVRVLYPAPLEISSPTPMPIAFAGVPYLKELKAGGGLPPYAWSGELPAGFTLSSDGVVRGIAASPGSIAFSATATDVLGTTSTRRFEMTVLPRGFSLNSKRGPRRGAGF